MCREIVDNVLSGTKAGLKATRNLVFNQKAERSTMNRQKSRGLVENVLSGMNAGFKSILNIFKHQKRESRMFNQKINQKSSSTLSTTLLALILGASVFMAGQVWAAEMVKDPSTDKMVTAPEYGGTLNLVWGPESEGPDPSITGHHAGFLVSGVYERLAQADWGVDRDVYDIKSGGVVPESFFIGQLAESWSQPDATTYVFKIRKGVHWHDKAPMNGRELTAKDIEYNWHRLATLGSGFTEPPARVGNLSNVPFESITATDDWTVVFKLKQPMLGALKIILDDAYTWILPPEVIKEHGDVADWRNVVGTGPYMLTEWIDGSSMTWKKNPDYWGYDEKYPENRLPYIDELKGLFMLDEATRLAALRTGKVGFGGMGSYWQINSLDDVESLQKTTDLELWPFYQRSNYAFSLNVTEPPFSDIRVRKGVIVKSGV